MWLEATTRDGNDSKVVLGTYDVLFESFTLFMQSHINFKAISVTIDGSEFYNDLRKITHIYIFRNSNILICGTWKCQYYKAYWIFLIFRF